MAAGETHDQLELIAPNGQVRFFDLDPARGVANIGRHPDNDIVLESPGIIPFHAVLDYHAKPYQLIWLDSAARAPRELNTDDLVQLDGYSLVVVSSSAAVPATAAPALAMPAAQAAAAMAVAVLPDQTAPPAPPPADSPVSSAPPMGPPSAGLEMDLDMLDAILMATEAQKDDIILVAVQALARDMEKKSTGDLDLSIAAGETATLEATITNGGDVVASFNITLPGIPLDWVSVSPAQVNLKEGGRVSVLISVTPPRKASVRARGYFYSVVVRSPEYPERLSSTPGMLVVQPFYQFSVGSLDPRQQTIPYSRRAGLAVLPVVNQGNSEACFRVEGEDDRRLCRFEFELPGEAVALATRAEVRVPPEQTLPVRMRIIPTKRPLVGLGRVNHPFAVTVTPLDSRQTPRSVLGQAQTAPLIGPVPIVLLAVLLMLLFVIIYRPAIYSFETSSPAISAGETVSLAWKARQFSGLRLEPGGLSLAGIQGTVVLAPVQDTLYTLTADNWLSRLAPKWFQATRQVRVSVSAVLPAFRQFSADRSVVTMGDSVNLAWDVARADSLTLIINGAAESLLPKEYIGNRTIKLDKKTTVVLVAINAYTPPEGVSRSLTLEVVPVPPVIPPPPVIKRFDITPQEIVAGQVVMLNWEATGVTKVTITGIGELPANGSVSVAPPNDTIYALTASNGMPGGSVSLEQKVSVRPAPTPTPIPGTPKIEFLKATPADAVLGSPEASAVKLTWQVTGDVTNIEISGTGTTSKSSGLPKSGTLTVAVDKQTLYILTAYNGSLSASQTVQVTVSNPVPVANSLDPSTTEATGGAAGLVLMVNGANFNPDSKVRVSGSDRATTLISTSRLSAALLPDDVKSAGSLNIVVFTPTPGGGTSSLLTLTVINPRPSITQVTPPFLFRGGAVTTLSITGQGFVNGASKVYFGATPRTTNFINSTQLNATLGAPDLAAAGAFSVTVRNPGPGGVPLISNAMNFEIRAEYPVPQLSGLSPTTAAVGGPGFLLAITGTNNTFVRDTTLINWQGTFLPNVIFSDTNHLSVFVTAGQLPAVIGTVNVSAVNPSPGGGQSSILAFTMLGPGLALSPTPVTATLLTDPVKTMQVTLSSALSLSTLVALSASSSTSISVPSSVVIPPGSLSTTFTVNGLLASGEGVSLTATLPDALGRQAAQAAVYVNNPAPSISALSPASALFQSGGFNLQVTGANFIPSSTVYWNGAARPTTYVSSTQLTANINSSDLARGGPVAVTVFNRGPGGGTSGAAAFDIQYQLLVYTVLPPYGSVQVTTPTGSTTCSGLPCQINVSSASASTATFQANPQAGYAFNYWADACGGIVPSCTLPINQNRRVAAYFAQAFTLALTQTGLGAVQSSPPGIDTSSCTTCTTPVTFTAPFVQGSSVYLSATSSPHARFDGWGGGPCSGSSPLCTVTINGPVNVTANFSSQYLLNVSQPVSGTGTITSSPPGISCPNLCQTSYISGTTVTLTAASSITTAFTGWGGPCASFLTNPCILTISGADITGVSATFTPLYPVNLSKSLTTAPTGGAVTSVSAPPQTNFACISNCVSQSLTFRANSVITLTANPSPGFAFVGWVVPGCGTSTTCSLTITGATNITANFQRLYDVTVNLSGSGAITGSNNATTTYADINCGTQCGPLSYPSGTTLRLRATPNPGYAFTGWAGGPCAGAAANPCVFAISQSEVTTAQFVPLRTLIVTPSADGSTSSTSPDTQILNCTPTGGTCTGSYADGTPVTLRATPAPGFHITGWTGVSGCGTANTCLVTMNSDLTVVVTYAPDLYALTVTPGGTGSGTVTSNPAGINCGATCSFSYTYNTVVALTPTASTGSTFTSWTGDCGGAGACSVTLTAARSVGATFTLNTFTLTVSVSNPLSGTVTSTPAGITCPGTCNHLYNYNDSVTLTAAPAGGATGVTWAGPDCSGAGLSSNPILMTVSNKACTVTFLP